MGVCVHSLKLGSADQNIFSVVLNNFNSLQQLKYLILNKFWREILHVIMSSPGKTEIHAHLYKKKITRTAKVRTFWSWKWSKSSAPVSRWAGVWSCGLRARPVVYQCSCLCEALFHIKTELPLFPGETSNTENGPRWDIDLSRYLLFFHLTLIASLPVGDF